MPLRCLSTVCIFFAMIFAAIAYAQPNSPGASLAGIRGLVVDAETGKRLPGVNIVIAANLAGTTTDANGGFEVLALPAGTYQATLSYIGYAELDLKNLKVTAGNVIDVGIVKLYEEAIALGEIVITPGQFSVMGDVPSTRQTLSEEDIKNMSYAEDITRAVARLPGVASNDFSSKFTVRGGESDEVLITLDGMELYEPFHQRDFVGGLFSIVDIETIEGIDLLTGGFSAAYGNYQSGVFSMKTKRIRDGQRRTSLGLSMMNARAYSDGTFAGNRGNYLFSARKGVLDRTLKLVNYEENVPLFYDMMAKIEYKLNPKHHLSFNALNSGDKTHVRDITEEAFDIHDTSYDNTYLWVNLNSYFNPKLYAQSLVYGGKISHNRHGSSKKYEFSDKLAFELSDVRDYTFYGIKQNWDWSASRNFYLSGGFDARQLDARYNYTYDIEDLRITPGDSLTEFINTVDIRQNPTGQLGNAWLSGRFRLLPTLYLESGLRYDYASYSGDKLWSPRAGFALALAPSTYLRGAWGYYYQSQLINNLDVNHGNSGFNPAELSKHYVLGLEHQFESGVTLRADGYYKDISRISPTYQNLRDPWEVFPESRNDVVLLDINGATAQGIEMFFKYDAGKKVSLWLSYALADAVENIEQITFDGLLEARTGKLPRINSQRHTIYTDLNLRPSDKWHFNLSWQYYDGWPLTTYTYKFATLENGDLHFYQDHSAFRADQYPAYHRMDLRINRHFDLFKGKFSTFLHVINLYNRKNLRKFDVDVSLDGELVPDTQGGYQYFRDDKNWFGITPILGISLEL